TMDYPAFLLKLSQVALIQRSTLHQAFVAVRNTLDITKYLNEQTITKIQAGFDRWLLLNSFNAFEIGYNRVNGSIHPTKFTLSLIHIS
ncbi:hypothetical protein QG044_11175, partial [Kingella kingae]|uniref:hypothetical protein n=1 Tax=Kingella kingae TaxID=504 RepID=UPI00254A9F19